MKKVSLIITGIQIRPDFSGVVLTQPSASNPSATGVFKYTVGQMTRLSNRLGFGNNVIAMKHVATLGAALTGEIKECKAGEAWVNEKTGEEGVYQSDFTDFRNEEIVLSAVAANKVAEMALQSVFAAAPAAPIAAAAPQVDNSTDDAGDEPS